MGSSFEKFQKRRLISSYFSVVLSVFLVLFLLGALGLFVIHSRRLSDTFKEEIVLTIFLKKEATDSVKLALTDELKSARFAKDFKYISKEQAALNHKRDTGEDFITFLGANPLDDSFEIHLKSTYANQKGFYQVEQRLRKNQFIGDVVYDKQLVSLVDDNIRQISFILLIVSGIFVVISILIINSSLRLSLFAHRFIIKTMQMVGATKAFIRTPFIWRNIILGLIGSLLAVGILVGLLFYVDAIYAELHIFDDLLLSILLLTAIPVLGLLITGFGTFIATQRFLNLRTDDLY
ncbi:MAG: cell division protein FtsX [Flavobacterium sp. BFFFF2]|nr:MAG: cell division protein FtsX [Flavobacterium sp. BFFFF2]